MWAVGDRHVKWLPSDPEAPAAADEAARLAWLQGRFPAPAPLLAVDDEAGSWLVTTAVGGTAAHLGERHPNLEVLVVAVASGLRRLHALPVAQCPFDSGWERLEGEVSAKLQAGGVDPAALGPPFDRYEADRLVELWRSGRPARDDLVVVHGDASLPNLVVEGGEVVSLVDVGRLGVGDRHLDLAVAHHSIYRDLGPQAVFWFYDAYGMDPDLAGLEHYRLGALLRRAPPAGPAR